MRIRAAVITSKIVVSARKGRSKMVLADAGMPVRVLRCDGETCLVRQDNMDYPPLFLARQEELRF